MTAAVPLGVARRGRLVFLRAVVPADYETIRLLEHTGDDLVHYRHRGATVAPEAYPAALWNGVLAQFCVALVGSAKTVGVVAAYGADFRNGHCKVAGIVEPSARRTGAGAEAFVLLFDHLFDAFPFRKLYLEVLAPNLEQFRNFGRLPVVEEGRLVGHEATGEGTWDLHVLAVHRDAWVEFRRSDALAQRSCAGAGTLRRLVEAADTDRDGFAAFARFLAGEFGWEGPLTEATNLAADLGVDSLEMLEVALVLEDLGGHEVPHEVLATTRTLGDLYEVACRYAFHR